jgi:hypothetical protein
VSIIDPESLKKIIKSSIGEYNINVEKVYFPNGKFKDRYDANGKKSHTG